VEFIELDAAVTIGRPQHRDGGADMSNQLADEGPSDGRLTL